MTQSPLDERLEELNLSVRAFNSLKRAGINTVSQILNFSDERFLAIRNLGMGSLREIRDKLAAYLAQHGPEVAQPRTEQPEQLSLFMEAHTDEDTRAPQPSSTASLEAIPLVSLNLTEYAYQALSLVGCKTVADVASLDKFGLEFLIGYPNDELFAHLNEQLVVFFSDNPGVVRPTPLGMLGLSIRPYRALMRGGITSVDQLAALSDDAVWAVRNMGRKSVEETQAKLGLFLANHPLRAQAELPIKEVKLRPASPPPPALADPELLGTVREMGIPLDAISIKRLGLAQPLQHMLSEAGVCTIEQLGALPFGNWAQYRPVEQRLNRYLTWLIEQDEIAWASEVANQGISPLNKLELASMSLEELTEKWFCPLQAWEKQVLRWRYGLDGEELTLKAIGERLAVTKARVQQIQNKALRMLQKPERHAIIHSLSALLVHLLEQTGGLINEAQLETAMRRELTIGKVNPVGIARLIFEMHDSVMWVREMQAWGLACFPLDNVLLTGMHIVSILNNARAPLPWEQVIARVRMTKFSQERLTESDDTFIAACLRVHPTIEMGSDGLVGLTKWNSRKLDEIILALRHIGKPMHFSVIAEQANALLPPDRRTSARNIHAILDRELGVFVHLGRGRYWLRDQMVTEASTLPQADFGDLFGAQLTRWQAELDRRQGGSESDAHMEVERLRDVGLDFFTD